jgi:hypothetical protein
MITAYIDPYRVTVSGSLSFSNVSYSIYPGPNGFQEIDLNVEATTLRKGNYNYKDKSIPAVESMGGNSLPSSLYLNAKPSWFGTLAWPAFDPTAANPNPSYLSIPAGYRFVNGGETPGAAGTIPQAPTIARVRRVLN